MKCDKLTLPDEKKIKSAECSRRQWGPAHCTATACVACQPGPTRPGRGTSSRRAAHSHHVAATVAPRHARLMRHALGMRSAVLGGSRAAALVQPEAPRSDVISQKLRTVWIEGRDLFQFSWACVHLALADRHSSRLSLRPRNVSGRNKSRPTFFFSFWYRYPVLYHDFREKRCELTSNMFRPNPKLRVNGGTGEPLGRIIMVYIHATAPKLNVLDNC